MTGTSDRATLLPRLVSASRDVMREWADITMSAADFHLTMLRDAVCTEDPSPGSGSGKAWDRHTKEASTAD